MAPPTHPASKLANLREYAAFAAELPWRYSRAWNGTTYQRLIALAWEQSRYVNRCTRIYCLGPGLEASFQELCHSRLPLLHLNRGRNEPAASASRLDEECAPVRALYGKDVALWRAHCGNELEPRTVAVQFGLNERASDYTGHTRPWRLHTTLLVLSSRVFRRSM